MGAAKRRTANVLLHPVRLAIVQQLEIGMRHLTVGQLALELPEIAPATLYRHVNALARAGICFVVGTRKVHSVEERVYAIRSPEATLARVDEPDGRPGSPERFDAIAMFLASLNADFEASKRVRRVRTPAPAYVSTVAHLTDADEAGIERIQAWMLELRSRPVPPNASLRLITFMDFPFARKIASNRPAARVRKRT